MRSSVRFFSMPILVVAIVGCSGGGTDTKGSSGSATAGDTETKAAGVVDKLVAGDYAGVVAMFDATMTAALPEAALRQTWEGLTGQVGAFKSRGDARTATEMGMTAVYIPCTFERASLTAKVVFDSQGTIAGLFFQ